MITKYTKILYTYICKCIKLLSTTTNKKKKEESKIKKKILSTDYLENTTMIFSFFF